LVFYGTVSTNRLYHTIEVGNVSYGQKHHAIKYERIQLNQHNHKLSSAWALWRWSSRHG